MLKGSFEIYHYLKYQEISKEKGYKIDYFNVWNLIDLILILINLTTLVLDLT
jgi:hypothetical protein